ncbi:DUF6542 domain-containing protein [Corynebacterium sp.]|uniref:DUF6542 domain-containing protein n=1 Tax=Corynebacterium sp. TaxID=1720 RepID=UPI003B3AC140
MTSDSTDDSAPLNRRGLIPVWAPLLVMAAVVLTGIVLGGVGTSYVILFAVSAVVCTALVELRGLFLTVVLLPVYWFFGITVAGLVGSSGTAGSGPRTALITAAYPAVEKFLWLVVSLVVCVVIAVARQRIDAAVLENQYRRDRARRRQMNDAEQNNQRLNARVRDYDRDNRGPRSRHAEAASDADDGAVGSDGADSPGESATGLSRPPAPRDERPRPSRRYASDRTSRADESRDAGQGHQGNRPETPTTQEYRTRTAAELREASRRRRSRSQDRPLDME